MHGRCRSIVISATLSGALALAGCYEGLTAAALDESGDSTSGGSDGDGTPVDETGSDGAPDETPTCEQRTPDPLRRLTHSQYLRSIERLTGVGVPDGLVALLQPVTLTDGGFDNAAEGLVMRQSDVDAFQRIAEYVARAAFDTEAEALVECDPADDACLVAFVDDFAGLAYRRPLAAMERDRIVALADAVEGTASLGEWARFATAIEVVLQSPNFLFVPELGEPTDVDGVVHLQPYELATRLALILWDELPDRDLLDRAAAGELDDPDGMRRVIEDALADRRAQEGLARLAQAWFELDAVAGAPFATAPTEAAAAHLRADARAELAMLLDHHVVRGDLRDLYTSADGFVTPTLARLYGVELDAETDSGAGTGLFAVQFDPEDRRGGLLGTAAFLATYASGDRASLVRRGAFVRRVALCTEPPPPPPDVEMGDPEVEDHASQAQCWACHQLLDPIGWGLERYAADGSLRELEPTQERVGYLAEDDEAEFSDAPTLGRVLTETDAFARCAAEKTSQWVFAKSSDEIEPCLLNDLTASLAAHDFHVPSLVAALVADDAFRHRVVPPGDQE